MASRTLIHDSGGLRIFLDTQPGGNRNEIQIDEVPGRAADAIGVRFGTYARSDNGGRPSSIKFSVDELTGDESAIGSDGVQVSAPRRSERLMAEVGPDDDPAAAPGAYKLEIFDQEDPVGAETDRDERRMLGLSKSKGFELYLPLNAYAGIARGAGAGGDISSLAEGNYRLHIQGDGNLVVYDTHGNATDASGWTPVIDLFSTQALIARVQAILPPA